MHTLMFLLGLGLPGAVADVDGGSLTVPRGIEVRAKPDLSRPAVLQLDPGDEIWITGRAGDFTRIRLRRAGGWKRGYVWSADLDFENGRAPAAEVPRNWGVGFLGARTSMRQGGRTFETNDQVTWTTSAYLASYAWPSVYVQYGRRDYLRLAIGQRTVDFTGSASAAVGVTNVRQVEVKQTMISGRVEKAFNVWRASYVSLGAEIARASSVAETLGGIALPTSESDLNLYVGASVGLGVEIAFADRFSGLVEGRYAYFPSVKPAVTAVDLAFGLAVWF